MQSEKNGSKMTRKGFFSELKKSPPVCDRSFTVAKEMWEKRSTQPLSKIKKVEKGRKDEEKETDAF